MKIGITSQALSTGKGAKTLAVDLILAGLPLSL